MPQPAPQPDPAPAENPIIVIPARMGSTRLPGKPLALIRGRPMILHVLERALAAQIGPVIVACCEPAVFDIVTAAGGTAIMTDPALPSGSDRVDAALTEFDPRRTHGTVVNLQGDLPSISPDDIRAVLDPLAHPRYDIATLVAPITSPEEAAAPSIVKAVCAFTDGATVAPALYFSRIPIPWGDGPLWHHIGIYAWRRRTLARFVRLPPSLLEEREKLEQLRALEAGMTIGCTRVAKAPRGVDTREDLEREGQGALPPGPPLGSGDPKPRELGSRDPNSRGLGSPDPSGVQGQSPWPSFS